MVFDIKFSKSWYSEMHESISVLNVSFERALVKVYFERDFSNEGARVVLYALSILNGKQGLSTIEKVLRGKTVERYRYNSAVIDATLPTQRILQMKSEMKTMKKKVPVSYFTKDLLPALIERDFVSINSQSSVAQIYGGRNVSSYTFFHTRYVSFY